MNAYNVDISVKFRSSIDYIHSTAVLFCYFNSIWNRLSVSVGYHSQTIRIVFEGRAKTFLFPSCGTRAVDDLHRELGVWKLLHCLLCLT